MQQLGSRFLCAGGNQPDIHWLYIPAKWMPYFRTSTRHLLLRLLLRPSPLSSRIQDYYLPAAVLWLLLLNLLCVHVRPLRRWKCAVLIVFARCPRSHCKQQDKHFKKRHKTIFLCSHAKYTHTNTQTSWLVFLDSVPFVRACFVSHFPLRNLLVVLLLRAVVPHWLCCSVRIYDNQRRFKRNASAWWVKLGHTWSDSWLHWLCS